MIRVLKDHKYVGLEKWEGEITRETLTEILNKIRKYALEHPEKFEAHDAALIVRGHFDVEKLDDKRIKKILERGFSISDFDILRIYYQRGGEYLIVLGNSLTAHGSGHSYHVDFSVLIDPWTSLDDPELDRNEFYTLKLLKDYLEMKAQVNKLKEENESLRDRIKELEEEIEKLQEEEDEEDWEEDYEDDC